MVAAGGRVLVDEAACGLGGQFPTVVLVVTQRFLASQSRRRHRLLGARSRPKSSLAANPVSAQPQSGSASTALGQHPLARVIAQSLTQVTFTDDPLPGPLFTEAQHAVAAGMLSRSRTSPASTTSGR